MGRRRRKRLHARPTVGSQPLGTRATTAAAAEASSEAPSLDGALTAGRGSKRVSVADLAPEEKDKRRKMENDDGETTEEDERTTVDDRNGADQNGSVRNGLDQGGSDHIGSDQFGSDQFGSDRNGSDQNGVEINGSDQLKAEQNGSTGVGSDGDGDEAVGGSSDPGPLPLGGQGDSETSILVTCGRNEGRLYLSKLRVVVNERCRSKCIRTGNTWWTPNEFQFVSGRGAAKDWKRTVKHAGQCLKALLANGTLCLAITPPRCLCDSCTSQGSGKAVDESDEAGRNINETGEDLSNGNLVEDASNIRSKGIKRRRRIKRHIKGAAPFHGDRSEEPVSGSEEPVSVASRKRRKFLRNAKPEAHSDSTVSLSAEGVFDSGTGSKASEEGGRAARGSDACRQGVSIASGPPLVAKRGPGRPKKKKTTVVVAPKTTPQDVALRDESEVKVTDEKNSVCDESASLGEATDRPKGCPDEATPSSELPEDGPKGQTTTTGEPLARNYSNRSNDVTTITPPTTTPSEPTEVPAETDEQGSRNDAPVNEAPHPNGTATDAQATDPLTEDAQTRDPQAIDPLTRDPLVPSLDVPTVSLAARAFTDDSSPEASVLPSDGKVDKQEEESVDVASTNPLPVCSSDETPSGEAVAPDGIDVDRRRIEDDVIASGDIKDDVKKRSSPAREDDVTMTSSITPNATEPRRKNAYLNAVIAELKRKKISRETSVTTSATKDQHQHQQHQRTRHPSTQLQQPSTVSSIKAELSPESKSLSDGLLRDIRSPSLFGLYSASSSSSSSSSNPSLAFVPSTLIDAKPPCLKPYQPDAAAAEAKHVVAPSLDSRGGSGTRRTSSSRANLPTSDEAAFWRHLPSAMEGKAGKGTVGGRVSGGGDMGSPLSISQLASICGLSQSQLASLPFPPPQFSLYPPYLFMGFPLQPLMPPEFQSVVPGSLPPSPAPTTSSTGGHSSVQRPPSRQVFPPAASSSSPAASTAPSSQHHQQQQPRRRRSHHHHHCKSSSSSVSGPPKDPLFRQPPSDHQAALFSALRKTDSMPTNHSAALLSELNRWRSSAPGISNQQWTGSTTKTTAPSKFNPTGSSVQERKLWRPAAAIASSAREYSSAYESIVPARSSAHASTKECAITCRSYGDTSLAAHAYGFDSSAPVDFTRRFRGRGEEERKYSSNTGSEAYTCDEQGVLDLSKK